VDYTGSPLARYRYHTQNHRTGMNVSNARNTSTLSRMIKPSFFGPLASKQSAFATSKPQSMTGVTKGVDEAVYVAVSTGLEDFVASLLSLTAFIPGWKHAPTPANLRQAARVARIRSLCLEVRQCVHLFWRLCVVVVCVMVLVHESTLRCADCQCATSQS
jgi:hypothetical protein